MSRNVRCKNCGEHFNPNVIHDKERCKKTMQWNYNNKMEQRNNDELLMESKQGW